MKSKPKKCLVSSSVVNEAFPAFQKIDQLTGFVRMLEVVPARTVVFETDLQDTGIEIVPCDILFFRRYVILIHDLDLALLTLYFNG